MSKFARVTWVVIAVIIVAVVLPLGVWMNWRNDIAIESRKIQNRLAEGASASLRMSDAFGRLKDAGLSIHYSKGNYILQKFSRTSVLRHGDLKLVAGSADIGARHFPYFSHWVSWVFLFDTDGKHQGLLLEENGAHEGEFVDF